MEVRSPPTSAEMTRQWNFHAERSAQNVGVSILSVETIFTLRPSRVENKKIVLMGFGESGIL